MSNHAAELSTPLGYGHLEIDLGARQLLRHGQPIRLTRTEWALLDLLARNAGHVLTHCFLLRSVWGDTYDESHEYLHTYINRLRRKLEEDPRQPRYLLTEPGLGYRLMPGLPTPSSAGVPPRSINLPVPTSPLLGREQEIAHVVSLLERPEIRLITLTGPGGVGKTRLALQAAMEARDGAPAAAFIPLAATGDPALVVSTIAQVLDIRETSGVPLIEELKVALRKRPLLLLLDNFEHLLPAAPLVAELLAAVHGLKVLVTSRATLRLSGEWEVPVTSLASPPRAAQLPVEQIATYPAIGLFVRRSQAINPAFTLTEANIATVAEICRRMDGLPLAIELAAAWSKILPPKALLDRLDRRLDLLNIGMRDAPDRQQTLRATIDWSYDLLTSEEQDLFTALGVFAGGFTVEAVEQVCALQAEDRIEVLGHLASLFDKNLVRRESGPGDGSRMEMLETIREYACERLGATGRAEELQRRHAAYYLAFAEQATQERRGARHAEALGRQRRELENLRAALVWALQQRETEIAMRLGIALGPFWAWAGLVQEGRRWLNQLLAIGQGAPAHRRASVLNEAGKLATVHGDYHAAQELLNASLLIARAEGDKRGIASALGNLSIVMRSQGDYAGAFAGLEESIPLYQELEDQWALGNTLNSLGLIAMVQDRCAEAVTYLEQYLALKRAIGDTRGVALALHNLGHLKLFLGDLEHARQCSDESYAIFHALEDRWGIALVQETRALVLLEQGHYQEAGELLAEILALQQAQGTKDALSWSFGHLAALAIKQGQPDRGGRLFGAAAALRHAIGAHIPPVARRFYAAFEVEAEQMIGGAAWQAAWAEGEQMPLEEAVRYASQ